jgi:hypothetical protein
MVSAALKGFGWYLGSKLAGSALRISMAFFAGFSSGLSGVAGLMDTLTKPLGPSSSLLEEDEVLEELEEELVKVPLALRPGLAAAKGAFRAGLAGATEGLGTTFLSSEARASASFSLSLEI